MDVHCINIDLRSNSTANPQFSVASQNSLGTFNKRKISYIDGTNLHLYCIKYCSPYCHPFCLGHSWGEGPRGTALPSKTWVKEEERIHREPHWVSSLVITRVATLLNKSEHRPALRNLCLAIYSAVLMGRTLKRSENAHSAMQCQKVHAPVTHKTLLFPYFLSYSWVKNS